MLPNVTFVFYMRKKEKQKRGDGVPVTVFLSGKYLEKVSQRQADYLIKVNRPLSRERAILKLLFGE